MNNIISLSEVKQYLKVDFNDDDDLLNNTIIPSAVNLMQSLIGKKTDFLTFEEIFMFKIIVFATIQELYDARELTEVVKSGASSKIKTLYSSIIYQLRYS